MAPQGSAGREEPPTPLAGSSSSPPRPRGPLSRSAAGRWVQQGAPLPPAPATQEDPGVFSSPVMLGWCQRPWDKAGRAGLQLGGRGPRRSHPAPPDLRPPERAAGARCRAGCRGAGSRGSPALPGGGTGSPWSLAARSAARGSSHGAPQTRTAGCSCSKQGLNGGAGRDPRCPGQRGRVRETGFRCVRSLPAGWIWDEQGCRDPPLCCLLGMGQRGPAGLAPARGLALQEA